MSSQIKRVLAFALALTLLIGCVSITRAEAGEAPEEWVIQVLTSPKSIVSRSDETSIGKVIKDKFGIVFEYIPMSGDSKERQNLLLATGDYPEITRLEGTDMFAKYVQAGALVCLDDYVEASENFKVYYAEQIPYWRTASPDGKLYKWEGGEPQDFEVDPEFLDIAVRTDLLEQQGWPNLLSEDDWFDFLKKALEDNPETNGARTVGLSMPMGESWGAALCTAFCEKGGTYVDQATNDAVIWNQTEQQWVETWKNEAVQDNLRWFNRLYLAGLLDPDCFTDLDDQVSQKCLSARSVAVWYCCWDGTGANVSLIAGGQPEKQYIKMPFRSNRQVEAGLLRECRVETTRPFDTYAITKNCADPDRLFAFIDWCAGEEGQVLLWSGIKDEHYFINDKGQREPTETYLDKHFNDPGYDETVGFGGGVGNMLPSRKQLGEDGIAYSLTSDANYMDALFLTDRQKEAYTALGWANSQEYWLKTSQAAPNGLTGTCALIPGSDMAKLDEKYLAWAPAAYTKLIIAEDFDATFAELDADYDAKGFSAVCDEYNRILAEQAVRLAEFTK